MIVQCPNCSTKYSLDERHFAGRPSVQARCRKCETSFSVSAPPVRETVQKRNIVEATRLAKAGDHLQLPADRIVALSVTQGPSKGQVFRLSKARVVLGRAGADIVLDDPEVSRKHCAIEVHGTTATLVDLGATNGTFVDGQRIQSCQLEHLSEFRVGSNTLLFTVTETNS